MDKRTNRYYLITTIYTLCALILDFDIEKPIGTQTLCNYFTWQDGHPCSKNKN